MAVFGWQFVLDASQLLSVLFSSQLTTVGSTSFLIRTIQTYGMKWVFYPASLVIVNDTMAYVCGVLFGKHALLPTISPKKTWEGFIGAAVFTLGLSVPVYKLIVESSAGKSDLKALLVIAAYVSLIGPFGGFLASVTKRSFGAKDFGTLIPGHGGLVDRFDCHLMTAPFVFLFLQHIGGVGTKHGD
jgi:CDP-diglyceride synthetase